MALRAAELPTMLDPIAMRPRHGNVSTTRNAAEMIKRWLQECCGEWHEQAQLDFEEVLLPRKNTRKRWWILKVYPRDERTRDALVSASEVYELDMGMVLMPDRPQGTQQKTHLCIEWTWWDDRAELLTAPDDLGDFHSQETVVSALTEGTCGVDLNNAASRRIGEELLMGFGSKKAEGLLAIAADHGHTAERLQRDMAAAGAENKMASEAEDPRGLRKRR